MPYDYSLRRYRNWYAKLLLLYPKPYHERFAEGMEQTFNDLLRERAGEERELFGRALWMFVETSTGIIRENIAFMMMQNITRRLIVWAAVVVLILLAPLIAMQFTEEVNWDLFDFAFMGTLLFGAGLAYELMARKTSNVTYRAAVGGAVATAVILVWVNAAVGIIGNEDLANLMYFGVIAVGIIGAIIARFKPHGMARALFATALAQALVAMIALIFYSAAEPGPLGILALNGFFVALFVGSALLFRRAARRHHGPGVEPTA